MVIDVYHDLICPWCFIGKHRLERALAERPRPGLQIRWQPFQLNPNMPRGGMDRQAYLAVKFGGADRALQAYAAVAEAAVRDGIELALERVARTPNTLDAHRLVRFLGERIGDPAVVVEAVFRAYFQEGRDIGSHVVLADIAVGLGCERDPVMAYLESAADLPAVRGADAAARQMGIQAVPCFVFDRRYALSGAQEPPAFLPLFDLAAAETDLTEAGGMLG